MTTPTPGSERIHEAGIDPVRMTQTSVLIKLDDVPAEQLRAHPVWPLCRALGALGFAIDVQGAIEYLRDLETAMRESNFRQTPGAWTDDAPKRLATDASVIVDLTHDRGSKELSAHLAAARSAWLVSVACGRTWTGVAVREDAGVSATELHAELPEGESPLLPVSRIAAGLVQQEILRMAAPIDSACPPCSEILYDVASASRTGRQNRETWPDIRLENVVLDVIGAGGIGMHLLESLAPLLGTGCELRIFDPDTVGAENLALQFAYHPDDVGQPKATVMAERLAPHCDRGVTMQPLVASYQERPSRLESPSLRIVCPDNFTARKYANDLSIADGIPLVEAGSSPLAAQQRSYLPGHTACLEHRIPNLAEKAAAERTRASCAGNPAPTLPGTNMVIGGILAAEALRCLHPKVLGLPSRGTITHDLRFPQRLGLEGERPPCHHS